MRAGIFKIGRAPRHGQAMVESLLVLLVLLAAFFFFYDFAVASASRLLLCNGAARAARADAVGFNSFHRLKSLRVGMIPVSGKRLVPDGGRSVVGGGVGELALVRTYLQSETEPDARGILDYERWSGLSHQVRRSGGSSRVEAVFDVPRGLPWRLGALVGVVPVGELQRLRAWWEIEDHASLYLIRTGGEE